MDFRQQLLSHRLWKFTLDVTPRQRTLLDFIRQGGIVALLKWYAIPVVQPEPLPSGLVHPLIAMHNN